MNNVIQQEEKNVLCIIKNVTTEEKLFYTVL